MKKMFLFIGIFAMLSVLTLKAQVTIGVNQAPDPSAVLDLQSKGNLGMLLPRVALTDTLLAAPLAANVPGMMVYNTNTSADGKVVEGVYINDGNRWWPATGGAAGPWDLSGTTTAAKLNTQNIYQTGQVTIGMDTLQPVTMLNVISDNKGIMIPRMTLEQRTAIDTTNANSLMIYNTDEDCYNYYSKSIGDWQSLCGGLQKAKFDIGDCDTSVTVHGAYIQGVALNGSNYLSIRVWVTNPGNYTITATTQNGYGFTGSGTFLDKNMFQTITLMGQGTPTNQSPTPGDLVTISSSGGAVNCNTLTIPVLPSVATYDITCGSIKANGAYIKGVQLGAGNTITIQVNVTDISSGGSWTIRSNVNNGISFLGSGVFTAPGIQTVTLYGTGTPTTTDPIPLTLTANSGGGESTCNTTIQIAYPKMTVLTLGGPDAYGYNMSVTTSAVYGMMTNQNNFGTSDNSTVKSQGFTWANGALETGTALQNDLLGQGTNCPTFPPDIVVMGYPWTDGPGTAGQFFLNYLQAGGVLIMYCEYAPTDQSVMRAIFGDNTITTSNPGGNGAGSRYQIPVSNDPVINGPFGNVGGLYWGEDASTTVELGGMTGKPMSFFTVGSGGGVTAFKHSSLYLLWTGDGGFDSNNQGTDMTICPFRVQDTTNYLPVPKPTYGTNAASTTFNGIGPVSNSQFTANAMTWALQAAMTNGINALNR